MKDEIKSSYCLNEHGSTDVELRAPLRLPMFGATLWWLGPIAGGYPKGATLS